MAEPNGESKADGAEPQAKRQRKRRSGWDAPAPTAVAAAPTFSAAAAAAASAIPVGFFQQAAANPAMVSLVQQQLAMAMAMPGGPQAAGTYQPALSGGYNIGGAFAQQAAIQAALAAAGAPGMAEVQERRRRSRIYVGNLHYHLQEPDVRAVFNPFGNIRSINLTVDPATGHHRGFCFVEYETPESAESALAHMDKFELAGRQISVGRPHDGGAAPAPAAPTQSTAAMLAAAMNPAGAAGGAAQPAQQQRFVPVGQCKIYVGNVPSQVNAEMLRTVFQPFGQVIGAEMVPDPANPGQHRGFGFLQFIEEKQARLAMDTMNNFELAGRNLRVSWAQDQVKPLPLLPGVVLPTTAASAPVSTADAVAAALRGAHVAMPTITSQPAPAAGAATSPTVAAIAASPLPPPTATAAVPAVAAPEVTAGAAAATPAAALDSSTCVVMDDMVTQEDLSDPGLADEIAEECAKFGMVSRVETVARQNLPSAARVFVVFADNQAALAAVHGLHERYFGGRVVQARLYDSEAFGRGDLEL